VAVGVFVGVAVRLAQNDATHDSFVPQSVAVAHARGVAVVVGVGLGVAELVGVRVGVAVLVGVQVRVGVALGVCDAQ